MEQTPVLAKSCPHCGAHMPEIAAFCPGCGRSMRPAALARGKVGIFRENIGGALSYFSFIPALIFLLVEPYRRNLFLRFHSIQCLLLWAVCFILAWLLKLTGSLIFMIPVVGPLFIVLIDVVAALAAFFVWLVLVVKALQGMMFQIPVLGDLADQLSQSAWARRL